jgi:hypothetical protein
MQPPCPHCDQPDMSLLRLVLIGEILRAEEPELVWLADVMQQSGLWHLAEEPLAPPRQPQLGTLHVLRHDGPLTWMQDHAQAWSLPVAACEHTRLAHSAT